MIYIALLAVLRIFGKREIGQFTIYDLVLILLVANAVQPAMTGPDTSLAGGFIIIASLVVANYVVGRLDSIEFFHRLFTSPPTVLIKDGEPQTVVMDREGVDLEELEMAVREHGLANVSDVALGTLEPDGEISIVGKDATGGRRRRRPRRRYRPGR